MDGPIIIAAGTAGAMGIAFGAYLAVHALTALRRRAMAHLQPHRCETPPQRSREGLSSLCPRSAGGPPTAGRDFEGRS